MNEQTQTPSAHQAGRPLSVSKSLDVFELAAERAAQQGRAGLYIPEVAYITGLCHATITAYVKDGTIPSYLVETRVGNRIVSERLIDAIALREWLASKRVKLAAAGL